MPLLGSPPGRGGSLLNGVTLLVNAPQPSPLIAAPTKTVQNVADPVIYIAPTPSGGIQFAGSAAVSKTKAYIASGVAQFAGSATTTKLKVYGFTPSGGIQTGGSAPLARVRSWFATGIILVAGGGQTAFEPVNVPNRRNAFHISINLTR